MLRSIKATQLRFKRSITTHHILVNDTIRSTARQKSMDMLGHIRGSLGILRLNREHRYNALTPNFVKNISRGLQSFYLNDNIRVVYMTTEEGKDFSIGTDLRTLAHYKKEDRLDKAAKYLKELYGL